MEFGSLYGMSYDEYVKSLLEKYGPAAMDYFTDSTLRERNNISRTGEGLFCHHIDEDKAVLLSQADYILSTSHAPFEYQKADRLVYCNYLEHLYLHIKIIEKELEKSIGERNQIEAVGIGGFMLLVREINGALSCRGNYPDSYKAWQRKCAETIRGREYDFILAVRYFVEKVWSREDFLEWYGNMVPLDEMLAFTKKIYEANRN